MVEGRCGPEDHASQDAGDSQDGDGECEVEHGCLSCLVVDGAVVIAVHHLPSVLEVFADAVAGRRVDVQVLDVVFDFLGLIDRLVDVAVVQVVQECPDQGSQGVLRDFVVGQVAPHIRVAVVGFAEGIHLFMEIAEHVYLSCWFAWIATLTPD